MSNNLYDDDERNVQSANTNNEATNSSNNKQQEDEDIDAHIPDDPKLAALYRLRESHHTRNVINFLLLGLVNNLFYCVVLAGAENLSEEFNLKNLMALVSWANIAGGIFIRFVNAFVWLSWTYQKRFLCAGVQAIFGITVVCIAPHCGTSDGFRFFVMLVGIIFIGTASSQGEQSALSYLQAFPSRTVGSWSSGTGFSGVVGALMYLGLTNTGMNESSIFATQLPFILLYWYCFYFGIVEVPLEEVSFREGTSSGTTELEGSFTPVPNWRRRWANIERIHLASAAHSHESKNAITAVAISTSAAVATTAASNSLSNPSSAGGSGGGSSGSSSSKSQLEMKTDENFQQKQRQQKQEAENAPLLSAGDTDQHQQHNNEPQLTQAQQDHLEAALTTYDNEADWGCFRRWIFKVAPTFPFEALVRCNRLILFQGFNLFLVYVFEYAIQFVATDVYPDLKKLQDRNSTKMSSNHSSGNMNNYSTTPAPPGTFFCDNGVTANDFDFFTRNAFVISQFCYQFGVLMSRSSLSVVRIKRVELLTLFQFVNFLGWMILAKTEWLIAECDPEKQKTYTWIMNVWMLVGVGICGGASYVNVFANILGDPTMNEQLKEISRLELARQTKRKLEIEQQEQADRPDLEPMPVNAKVLAMNVGALYQTVGITCGALFDVIINNTLIKNR